MVGVFGDSGITIGVSIIVGIVGVTGTDGVVIGVFVPLLQPPPPGPEVTLCSTTIVLTNGVA